MGIFGVAKGVFSRFRAIRESPLRYEDVVWWSVAVFSRQIGLSN